MRSDNPEEEVINALLAADIVNITESVDFAGEVEETTGVARSSSAGVAEEPFQLCG